MKHKTIAVDLEENVFEIAVSEKAVSASVPYSKIPRRAPTSAILPGLVEQPDSGVGASEDSAHNAVLPPAP